MNLLSSMMRVFVSFQRRKTFLHFSCPRILPTSLSTDSCPRPVPAQECRVTPPILTAAIPVDAVMPTLHEPESSQFGGLERTVRIISRSKIDFPVPIGESYSC